MRRTKKMAVVLLAFLLCLVTLIPTNVQAKKKVKLNSTKKTIYVGNTCTIKLLNNSKSVKWSTSNKNIKITKKSKKSATIKGVKNGTSYLKAKVGKKTYKCKVMIKKKTPKKGTRANPLSAYNWNTVDIYGARYYGKFKIKLLEYKDGNEAFDYLSNHGANKKYKDSKEYIYLKFKINYIKGKEEVPVDLAINDYSDFFDYSSRQQLSCERIKYKDGTKDLNKTTVKPGKSVICSKAIVINKGNTPITYRALTGYDKKYNMIYTWFTTKRK